MCRTDVAIAIVLVVLVVALFLRRFWATAIPVFTIPVALAATLRGDGGCSATAWTICR